MCIVGKAGSTNKRCKVKKCAQSVRRQHGAFRRGNHVFFIFWKFTSTGRTRRDGDHVNSLSAPAAAPTATATTTAANRAPTVPPPPPAALNLPCSSLPPRYSQRFAEAVTCGNFGSSSSQWQWRNANTTTAAPRAAFAHRKRGSGFPAPEKNIPLAASRMENFVPSTLLFSPPAAATRSSVRRFAPVGVRKVSAWGE